MTHPQPDSGATHLLVVDDSAVVRSVVAKRLREEGYVVHEAESAAQAYGLIAKQHIHLVLLDSMMPDVDGLEALFTLRKTYTSSQLPVIMVTANPDSAHVVEALELGANDYVTKPVDFPVLLARIDTQLALKRAESAARLARESLEEQVAARTRDLSETNARLGEAQRQLNDALDAMSEGFMLLDADDRLVKVNTSLKELTPTSSELYLPGTLFEDLVRRTLDAGIIAGVGDDPEAWVRQRMEQHRNPQGPIERRYSNGTWVRLEERRTSDGGRVVIHKDITEQKQAELSLRANRKLLQTVFDTMPHWLFVKNRQGNYLMVNTSMARGFGLKPADFIGRNFADVAPVQEVNAENIAASGESDRTVFEEGKSVTKEASFTLHDGKFTRRVLNKMPLTDGTGRVIGMVGVSQNVTDLFLAEERTERHQALLQGVFDAVPHWLFAKDSEFRYLMVNRAMAKFYGLTPEEFIGKRSEDVTAAGSPDNNPTQSEDERVLEQGLMTVALYDVVNPDGGMLRRRVVKTPLLNKSGKVTGLVGLSEDTSERERLAEEVRVSEERLSGIVTIAHEAIISVDQSGKILLFNRAAEETFGYTIDQVLGQPLSMLLPERHRTGHDAHMRGFSAGTQASRTMSGRSEIYGLRSNGEEFPAEASISKADLPGGTVFTAVLRDITERKRAEEELRASRRLMQDVIDTLPHWISVSDTQGTMLFVNHAMAVAHGGQTDQFEQRPLEDVGAMLGLDPALLESLDAQVLRDGERLDLPEVKQTTPDGHERVRRMVKFPLRDERGQATGVVTWSEDITDRLRSERELRQAQKMEAVGQLTGGIAHDFNNILQVISGYAQLIAMDAGLGERGKEHLAQVVEAGEKASQLTRRLLTLSREDALKPRYLDINEVMRGFVHMLRSLIGAQIALQTELGENLPTLFADSGLLEQVLLNLCINARDAMPDGGELTLATSQFVADSNYVQAHGWDTPGTFVQIAVSDTGTGMSPEVRDKIFEPFFTTKEAGKGTGLGLAMVYGIVTQHAGHVHVYSEPGKGTTFRLFLPASDSAAVEQAHAAEEEVLPRGQETILIVEDEEVVRDLTVALLEQQGYSTYTAVDGQQALEVYQLHQEEIDLVLLDVVMPKLSGKEAYLHLRTMNPGIKAIFSTGYASNVLDQEFLERAPVTLIQKPHRPQELYRVVRQVLDGELP